jgi:hypothetical protein
MNHSQIIRILAAATALLTCLSAQAELALPEPNWDLQEARAAASQVDALAAVKPLFELARTGRDDELLRALAAVENRGEWPEPAREYVLLTFALGLADLPPGAVGPDVLAWLTAHEPRTLVPHDDHPLAGVPLYGIRPAAAGVAHAWERQAAAVEAGRLLERGAEAWIAAYLGAAPPRQRGFVDALDQANPEQLRLLADQSLQTLPAEPELTAVAARAGILLSDPAVFQSAVTSGAGPGVAAALRSGAPAFDEIERAEVLRHAIAHAPPVNASLAIAELAPALLHQAETAELMFAKLGDPEIGAAAALALAASKDPLVMRRLNHLAKDGAGLQAARAAIAVESSRTDMGGARQ